MARLTVNDFSCISEAALDLGRLTILTGPQGSGKSVLCKLVYFFYKILADEVRILGEGESFPKYLAHLREEFELWFPPSAWGQGKFRIEFEHGDLLIRLTRFVRRETPTDAFRIAVSPELKDHYRAALSAAKDAFPKGEDEGERELDFEDPSFRIRELARRDFRRRFGSDSNPLQLFIPAGRSFFTSVGKAVVAYEHGIDPITHQFGKSFLALREQGPGASSRIRRQSKGILDQTMRRLFGGELVIEKGKEYVQTEDGRRVPLSSLSSGQQELLPMWVAMSQRSASSGRNQLIYIEEPEAHLFPEAQSAIIEAFVSMIMASGGRMNLVLTTHSPYVLSKVNNLILAGQIINKWPAEQSAVDKIVPRFAQLSPRITRAYALGDRSLHPIVGDEGLIDAKYLDSVSGDISREFDSLLEIEGRYGAD